jgi:energy-coupling factor transport system substrate-specific component
VFYRTISPQFSDMPDWILPVLLVAAFVSGLVGGLIGQKIFKKHFERAGIV